jgi:excisionase family DNA binding protein
MSTLAIQRDGYLTRSELAEHLGVSEKTIARWQAQQMPAEVWGRRLIRYRLDRVETWLERKRAA